MREQTLGQFIRANRLAMGMTQEELASRVGDNVRQSDISRLENDGVDFPRRERLDAIAVALGVKLGDLLISTRLARNRARGDDRTDQGRRATGSRRTR